MGLLQISAALILVLILIFVVAYLIRKANINMFKEATKGVPEKPIEILYSINITPSIILKLIKVDKYVLLIGCTNQQVYLLKDFNEQDSVFLEQKCRNKNEGQFLKILISRLNDDKKLKPKKEEDNQPDPSSES